MRIVENVEAWGHPNIVGTHGTTFEFTTERNLTRRGDCVLAVNASKGAADLSDAFTNVARRDDAIITVMVRVGDVADVARGRGSPNLTFTHPTDLVARTSGFTCGRTLMIRADKAASDFSRQLIHLLTNPQRKAVITLVAEI
jgi:hypothetical protein